MRPNWSRLEAPRCPAEERVCLPKWTLLQVTGKGYIGSYLVTTQGTLVTLYNGVRRGPYSEGETPDDWDKCGYSIGYFSSTTAERGSTWNPN